MPDASLLMLLDEVRGKTLRLLQGVTEAHAHWAPDGLQNTILWHAGHALVVGETLTARALGIKPQYPTGWFELFGWDSRPGEIPRQAWPALRDVIAQLRVQYQRMRELVQSLSDEDLDRPSAANRDRPVRYAILHGLHDEACHSGEIWLLRKLQAVSP